MLACLQARREVSNLNAEDLGFSGGVDVSHISLYDHLTPRLQELLFESKKFKDVGRRMDSFTCGRRIPQPL